MDENYKNILDMFVRIGEDTASIKTEINALKESQRKDIELINKEIDELKNETDKLIHTLSTNVDKKIDELKTEVKEWKVALVTQLNDEIDRLRQEYKREDITMSENIVKELNYIKKDCDKIKSEVQNIKNDVTNLKQLKDKADAERWRKVIGYIITGIGGILLAQLIPYIKMILGN